MNTHNKRLCRLARQGRFIIQFYLILTRDLRLLDSNEVRRQVK